MGAGEQAGILDSLLDRLATYKEKILAIKSKIKSALFYPVSIIVVALVITAVIMIFVIPTFKDLFKSFGADLPAPTQIVMNMSDFFVANWYLIFGGLVGGRVVLHATPTSARTKMQNMVDRLMLRLPIFGDVIRKATIARWCRTLSTMFAAGVPLVEALDSVAGAAGNYVYYEATKRIQAEVSTGTGLTVSMQNTNVFPSMVLQMTAIGEESGALDSMLSQGGRLLRGRGRRGGRGALLPDGAAHHGGAGRPHRRPGGRHVPADLQDGFRDLTRGRMQGRAREAISAPASL